MFERLLGICSVCCHSFMQQPPPNQVRFGPAISRLADVMAHSNNYAFHGVTRLSKDARVSAASISRLINGKMNPSFIMVARITAAIEKDLGYQIDPRDVVAEAGKFLTRCACDLVACRGCYPDNAYDEFGDLKPAFAEIKPGTWVTSRYPKGYEAPRKETR